MRAPRERKKARRAPFGVGGGVRGAHKFRWFIVRCTQYKFVWHWSERYLSWRLTMHIDDRFRCSIARCLSPSFARQTKSLKYDLIWANTCDVQMTLSNLRQNAFSLIHFIRNLTLRRLFSLFLSASLAHLWHSFVFMRRTNKQKNRRDTPKNVSYNKKPISSASMSVMPGNNIIFIDPSMNYQFSRRCRWMSNAHVYHHCVYITQISSHRNIWKIKTFAERSKITPEMAVLPQAEPPKQKIWNKTPHNLPRSAHTISDRHNIRAPLFEATLAITAKLREHNTIWTSSVSSISARIEPILSCINTAHTQVAFVPSLLSLMHRRP